jgi:hypothetical protein
MRGKPPYSVGKPKERGKTRKMKEELLAAPSTAINSMIYMINIGANCYPSDERG